MPNWLVTPVFAKAALLSDFLGYLYSDRSNVKGFHHVILGNHYPIDEKNNTEGIRVLAEKFDCIYIDSLYDRGLHGSLNNALNILDIGENDIFIGCDCDDRPSPGAFQAMKEVMLFDPTIGVLGLNFWVLPWKMKEHGLVMQEKTVAGHKLWVHPGVEMWNIAAFNMKLMAKMGGFSQPNAYYGGIEVAIQGTMAQQNMKLCYLQDFSAEAVKLDRDDPSLFDKSYRDWKTAHAHGGFQGSYEKFLLEGRKTA